MKQDYYGKRISPTYLITDNQQYSDFGIWTENEFRDPVLAEKYKNTIQEYLDRGYAQKPTTDQGSVLNLYLNCTGITKYMPHLCVSSKSKPDKICVVFNAGAKYSKMV